MFWLIFKAVISAIVIAFASWLAGKKPELAGFIIALPLATLLALLFTQTEFQSTEHSVRFARSILVAVPISLLFFIPFLLAEKMRLSFWQCYTSGLALLIAGYFIHRYVIARF